MKTSFLLRLLALFLVTSHRLPAGESQWLWQIGTHDTNNAEFALAPGGYQQFQTDGFFVVGESDARRDWPYVQPGPEDRWAGSCEHTFTVLFGLKSLPGAGESRLHLTLLDIQGGNPPKLRVDVNGHPFDLSLPRGAGDASIGGQPGRGRPHTAALTLPANLLKAGENQIRITTRSGSWLLYDWLGLEVPPGAVLASVPSQPRLESVKPQRALVERGGRLWQPLMVNLRHFGDDLDGVVRIAGAEPVRVPLHRGTQAVELLVPAVTAGTNLTVILEAGGAVRATQEVTVQPVRRMTVFILPHSHTDIGYTEVQTDIQRKQVQNLLDGMAAAKRTAGYPEGSRFVWNVEVLWAADLYLQRLTEAQRADFLTAVKQGQVVLNGMYLNELTGLCRPEELLQLFRYATQLAQQTGVPIDSAMISDVPGYTWGTVTAMSQAGIKYFSTAPNFFDRIGTILREWENKPFYWVGPDGRSEVLVWIPLKGYALSHIIKNLTPAFVSDYQDQLDRAGYAFDIAHLRWSGHGDNAVPDPEICTFVRDWNARYAWPKLVISGTGQAFRAFEERYGKGLPRVRGDWTPYWEDGAGSSALETAMNRASSDRLSQAEALFALRDPARFPALKFSEAWRSVLLYSEHTWGAWCSVSEPERKETREQWVIKKAYADTAATQSQALLQQALSGTPVPKQPSPDSTAHSVDLFNTLSWQRTELVTLPASWSLAGDGIKDDQGKPLPSQRLANGDLVFLAKEVPPLAARRYSVGSGAPFTGPGATAQRTTLDNGIIRVRVDEITGGIVELTAGGMEGNFADTSGGEALNDYRYLIGDDLKNLQRNGPVRISIGEPGPLVASLIIESGAPGCRLLRRELRVVAGADYVEIINHVDKERLAASSYKQPSGKESVNFAFPFNVPDGDMLLDVPLGVMRPDQDQMPSACKNWFTVGRWADVSNRERGITWVTLDAPLVEIGGLTATLLESQANPDAWRKQVGRTQRLYSWAMNNHWGTNYRAYQEGPTVFRFILRPHPKPHPAEASRFAIGFSQPLLPVPASGEVPPAKPLLRVEPSDVLVSALKPSDDGRATIVRLFGASAQPQQVKLTWANAPRHIWLSNTSEQPLQEAGARIEVPAWGLVTLRAERP